MLRLLCLAVLIAPASAIANEPPAPATTVTVAKVADDGDKPVCRRVTTIGSNIPGKKVCVSRRDYEAAQRAARDQAEALNNSGGGHQSGN
jgi:hypothetical protein